MVRYLRKTALVPHRTGGDRRAHLQARPVCRCDAREIVLDHGRVAALPRLERAALALTGECEGETRRVGGEGLVERDRLLRVPRSAVTGAHARHRGMDPEQRIRSEEHTSELQSRENLVC